jgi:predicted NAD/FAD-dependent oxidoreductase
MEDVLIIGAGISGLLCATELERSGAKVQLIDKGRGVGGRMSTRHMEGARLDHGAQFFTVRESAFQRYVDEWLRADVIKEWFRKAPYDSNPKGYPRYCGIDGMSAVPRYLAQDLNVHCSEVVDAVRWEDQAWQVFTRSKKTYQSRYLVITAPLPQALGLLDASGLNYAGEELDALRSIRYKRGLTTLAILEGPSGLPVDGFLQLEDSPVTWLADNQMKGISQLPCVTLQSSPEFADLHWDSPDDVRGTLMIEAVANYLKSPVSEYVCHRWGFALSENRYRSPYFYNPEYNLALAGDAFFGGRVEGAALSGIQVAEKLRQRLLDDEFHTGISG